MYYMGLVWLSWAVENIIHSGKLDEIKNTAAANCQKMSD